MRKNERKKDNSTSQILDLIPNPVIICNLAGKIVYYNPEAQHLLFKEIDKKNEFYITELIPEYKKISKWVEETQEVLRGKSRIDHIKISSPENTVRNFEKSLTGIEMDQDQMILLTLKQIKPGHEEEEDVSKFSQHLLQASSKLTDYIAQEGVNESIVRHTLELLGQTVLADRVYIFKNRLEKSSGEIYSNCEFEWVMPGISEQINRPAMKNFSFRQSFPDIFETLNAGQIVNARPQEFNSETRQEMDLQEIKSILLVPIHIQNSFWGLIGFDSCRVERTWPPSVINFLKMSGNTIALALEKEDFLSSLQNLIKEKEIMLNQLNHRTKNNLALIYGLIECQNEGFSQPELIEYSENIKQRILNIALIHEMLSLTDTLNHLSFCNYIKQLVSKLENTFLNDKKLTKHYNMVDFALTDLNQMVTLGVLINEILLNAFKHALLKTPKPELSISSYRLPEGVVISIKDNGPGLKHLENPIENSESVGFKIIKGLLDQLRGELIFQSSNGAEFTLVLEKLKVT
jgi:two-component sensor histidine kinase